MNARNFHRTYRKAEYDDSVQTKLFRDLERSLKRGNFHRKAIPMLDSFRDRHQAPQGKIRPNLFANFHQHLINEYGPNSSICRKFRDEMCKIIGKKGCRHA